MGFFDLWGLLRSGHDDYAITLFQLVKDAKEHGLPVHGTPLIAGVNEIFRENIKFAGKLRETYPTTTNYRIMIRPTDQTIGVKRYADKKEQVIIPNQKLGRAFFPPTTHELYFVYGDYRNIKKLRGGFYLFDYSIRRPLLVNLPSGDTKYMPKQGEDDLEVTPELLGGVAQSIRGARKIFEKMLQK